MSTQTYDIIVLLSIVILVAIIIFWAVQYGAGMVADMMNEAPVVLQSSFASYASLACGADGDMYFSHRLTKGIPMYAFMNATHVRISPAGEKLAGETERGGSVSFSAKRALPFINCGTDVVRKNVRFNENVHHYITVNKTAGSMQIGVK
ncbi:MAG: hypothetical protein QXD77_00090 [Candidatus Aenigmatarchaeota archaeon]